ncbi:MAG TPA: hypothetical protein VFV58_35720 [Blastocatellia bacterium]|jgi:hypothetical protein|nr:hypothetical protein [Blastocatellia bacterium]
MDLTLRIIRARDFLKVTPTGEVELKTSKQTLMNLTSFNAAPRQYDILIDARQKSGFLTLADIAELVEVMLEHRDSFRSKLAILAIPGLGFDHAKFMELYANNRGFHVAAFMDFEEAMNWLMDSTELTADA